MHILITGSRYASWDKHSGFIESKILQALKCNSENSEVTIVHGGAQGVDDIADRLAKKNKWKYISVPANWSKYGRSAGPKRNQEMLDSYGDEIRVVLAFPSSNMPSNGTQDMIRRSETAGKPVLIYKIET